jgi:hypothetical protein
MLRLVDEPSHKGRRRRYRVSPDIAASAGRRQRINFVSIWQADQKPNRGAVAAKAASLKAAFLTALRNVLVLTIGSRPERDSLNGRAEPISVSSFSLYDRRSKSIVT